MLKINAQNIQILLPCEPFRATESKIDGNDLYISFEHVGEHERCPECGERLKVHKRRHLKLLGPPMGLHRRSFWNVEYYVYRCDECALHKTQDIPFRFRQTNCTTYLAKQICDDLSDHNQTIKSVSRRYGLKWDRVKRIHKAFLKTLSETVPAPDGPEIAAVDEFAIEKHHKYATFVINAKTKYPLYIHRGNSAADFRPFFSKYSKSFYSKIKAFSMDQNASYSSVVKEMLPKCVVVCDYFHIMKNYNDQVIDAVRKRTMRLFRISEKREMSSMLKHSSRLLNKRISDSPDNPEEWEAKLNLHLLMKENHDLDVCLHMRETLQKIYDSCRDEQIMRKQWNKWCRMAECSGVPELLLFARNKRRYENEIINHARFPISSGVIEGCMNKIKVLKRVAFGFRDWEYFFLRIWNSFLPENLKQKYSDQIWQSLYCSESDMEETNHDL